ncbi:MAG: undecaprenyldiphospho-muramoylpentapeptide beta-N-acetylglucosaminyltransferase [Thermaerobacter sp.]|nr:undecaprenyldiphospho-muramoylpentapeptide beta-N-acetylglucosaminyltransferase [Thermaerobacter sp.]
MRVVLAGGGSGGHIYPALAIARGLADRDPETRILYVGTNHGLECDVVPRTGLPMATIHARGLLGRGVTGKITGVLTTALGVWEGIRIMRRERPAVVVGTGGFVSGPVGLAAWLTGVPLVIQEQNVWPGLTNRLLGRRARTVLVPYPEAVGNFPRGTRTLVAGNPVRLDYTASRRQAREELGLDPGIALLMITGGSQGAAAVNAFAAILLQKIAGDPTVGLVWATGTRYYRQVLNSLGTSAWDSTRVRVVEYFYEAQKIYRAADVFFGRAGAMTLADCAAFGLPAILVPSPNVAEDHQTKNARVFAERGAGLVMAESQLAATRADDVLALLGDGARRAEMAQAARGLYDPRAEERILDAIIAAATVRT